MNDFVYINYNFNNYSAQENYNDPEISPKVIRRQLDISNVGNTIKVKESFYQEAWPKSSNNVKKINSPKNLKRKLDYSTFGSAFKVQDFIIQSGSDSSKEYPLNCTITISPKKKIKIFSGNTDTRKDLNRSKMIIDQKIFADGTRYNGFLSNDFPHGYGVMTYSANFSYQEYRGEWSEGKFDGRGVLKFTDGRVCRGTFKNGSFINGEIVEVNGNIFEGNVIDDLPHGYGKMRYANHPILVQYQGQWDQGVYHGKGHLTTNSYIYIGDFVYYKKEGNGILMTSQRKYVGEFKENKLHGQGTLTDGNKTLTGQFEWGKFKF